MKEIVLLGSTGSIGMQTLDVCKMHNIRVRAMTANTNTALLELQAREFMPEYVCVYSDKVYPDIKRRLADTNIKVLRGMDGLCEISRLKCDILVNALVGIVGLMPTIEAIRAGNSIALANKETLVAGGKLITNAIRDNGVMLIPIDSEHSAIFQCLVGERGNHATKIILTASGGPFYGRKRNQLREVSVEEALEHPNWSMGAKITIDSATMMNKGLELIEAVRLFNVTPDMVEIVVHRQSVIHSAVEFEDGAIMAQLGVADMRIPIQYALTCPQRIPSPAERLSLTDIGTLTFEKPDEETFNCLMAARKALERGGNAPCIINSANEAAVSLFLRGKIRFVDIGDIVNDALSEVKFVAEPAIGDIINTHHAAEEFIRSRYD